MNDKKEIPLSKVNLIDIENKNKKAERRANKLSAIKEQADAAARAKKLKRQEKRKQKNPSLSFCYFDVKDLTKS